MNDPMLWVLTFFGFLGLVDWFAHRFGLVPDILVVEGKPTRTKTVIRFQIRTEARRH